MNKLNTGDLIELGGFITNNFPYRYLTPETVLFVVIAKHKVNSSNPTYLMFNPDLNQVMCIEIDRHITKQHLILGFK